MEREEIPLTLTPSNWEGIGLQIIFVSDQSKQTALIHMKCVGLLL